MSRAVALSRIQELGVRGRDDPAPQPLVWAGMAVNAGGLRALHEALHPTLLLLALAGYRIDQLVIGPPVGGDILLVTLSPRSAVATSWADYMESDVAPAWPSTQPHAVLMWLEPRPGLTGTIVPVDATAGLAQYVRTVDGFDFLVYDGAAPDLAGIANQITIPQQPARLDLATRIMNAWMATDWDVGTTGLLAALQPDLWTFPSLTDDEDLQREAFRALGEPIAAGALQSAVALLAFLIDEASVRGATVPPSVRDRLRAAAPDDAEDLERGWNTEAQALWARVHPDAAHDPFRAADHRRLSYSELVFDMLNESLVSLAGYSPADGEGAYGGYDLRRGDKDPRADDTGYIYAGQIGVADVTEPLPAYVAELRQDLEQIGFGPLADGDLVDDPTTAGNEATDATRKGSFGAYLESAVREFQIYAAMDVVARVGAAGEVPVVKHSSIATGLLPQQNDEFYTGPISGVLNAQTRSLVKMWVERDWFCPVVIEARKLTVATLTKLRDPASIADKRALVTDVAINATHQNIWRRTQVPDTTLAFIAWDFTNHFPATAGRPWGVPMTVATYHTASWNGAFARAGQHTWPEAEIRPDNIFGANPNPAQRPQQAAFWSTFRVIRAISEVECQGVLDGMNAYDSAILSGGPVHWTLGLAKRTNGKGLDAGPADCVVYPGELCPAVSMLAHEDAREYGTFFGAFGLQPREAWADPPVAMFSSGHRKYRGWVMLQDEAGAFADTRKVNPATVAAGGALAANHDDFLLIEVLHHWHWVYRWQMAPRMSRILRERMWALGRARLRALVTTPWGGIGGAPAGCTLGDVFTSEMAVAILERIHVYSPETLFKVSDKGAEWDGQTTANIDFTALKPAFDEAVKSGGTDPQAWGDAEEAALVQYLIDHPLKDDIPTLIQWPILNSYASRKHELLLPLVMEETPDFEPIQAISAVPGDETRVPVTVTDRETVPGELGVSVKSVVPNRFAASVDALGGTEYELVIEPPANAAGEAKVTLVASDGRAITEVEVMVKVTADGSLPAGAAKPYAHPEPVGLSRLRWSFALDESDLFQQPPS